MNFLGNNTRNCSKAAKSQWKISRMQKSVGVLSCSLQESEEPFMGPLGNANQMPTIELDSLQTHLSSSLLLKVCLTEDV